MPARKPEELLGGYATGTLTAEERRALFEAALQDQALFDALADEQALKELLEDPVTRRRLAEALQQASRRAPASRGWGLLAWLKRPANLGLAGTVATALLLVVVVVGVYREGGLPVPGDPSVKETLEATPEQATARPDEEQTSSAPPGQRKDRAASSSAPAAPQLEESTGLPPRAEPSAPRAKDLGPPPSPGRSAFRATAQPAPSEDKRAAQPAVPPTPAWRVTASFGGDEERARAADRLPAPAEKAVAKSRAKREQAGAGGRSESAGPAEERTGSPERLLGIPAAPALGLRYRVVERDARGTGRIIGTGGTLDPRRAIDITVEVDQPGSLYVVAEGDAGRRLVLHPSAAVGPETSRGSGERAGLRSGGVYRVSVDALLQSAQGRGPVRVFILLARRPIEGRDAPVADLVVAAVRQAGHASALRVEALADESDSTSVVNSSDAPDAVVAVTLAFTPASRP